MKSKTKVLFLDIGGVLLTNSWGHQSRKRAAQKFDLKLSEIEVRHRLIFETYEQGKLSIDDYYTKMIDLIARIKRQYGLKVLVLSNEAREVNAYRIRKFELGKVADFFISSCFVQLRKPDKDMFRIALDFAQTSAREVVQLNSSSFLQDFQSGVDFRLLAGEMSAKSSHGPSFGKT